MLPHNFESRIDRIPFGGCWVWTGATNGMGYGYYRCGNKTVGAHRVSYEVHKGPIPEGKYVCHTCDNPCCVNPEHLFVGSASDNQLDAVAKGRSVPMRGMQYPKAKLTDDDVREIMRLRASGVMGKDLATKYGICLRLVWSIVHHEAWKHISKEATWTEKRESGVSLAIS